MSDSNMSSTLLPTTVSKGEREREGEGERERQREEEAIKFCKRKRRGIKRTFSTMQQEYEQPPQQQQQEEVSANSQLSNNNNNNSSNDNNNNNNNNNNNDMNNNNNNNNNNTPLYGNLEDIKYVQYIRKQMRKPGLSFESMDTYTNSGLDNPELFHLDPSKQFGESFAKEKVQDDILKKKQEEWVESELRKRLQEQGRILPTTTTTTNDTSSSSTTATATATAITATTTTTTTTNANNNSNATNPSSSSSSSDIINTNTNSNINNTIEIDHANYNKLLRKSIPSGGGSSSSSGDNNNNNTNNSNSGDNNNNNNNNNSNEPKTLKEQLYTLPTELQNIPLSHLTDIEPGERWLGGMVEVELPMEYKLRNIVETEKAKQELLIPKPKQEKIFEIPRNYNQDYSSHSYQKMKVMEFKRKTFEKHLKLKHENERKQRRLYGPNMYHQGIGNTTGLLERPGSSTSSVLATGTRHYTPYSSSGGGGGVGGGGGTGTGGNSSSSSIRMGTDKAHEFKGGAFAPDALKAPTPKRRKS